MLHSSLNIKEEVSFNNGLLTMPESSSRLIGVVDVNEYDAYGRKIFSTRNMNDITLPGSIFMLEQMFKVNAEQRFLHPTNNLPYSYSSETGFDPSDVSINTSSVNIFNQKVFGFMVGIEGEYGANVIAPDYNITSLTKFVPFRSTSDSSKINELNKNYTFAFDNGNTRYYYVKKFSSDPFITTRWADGSGEVNAEDIGLSKTTPIVTYAQCELIVDAEDVRNYFGEMNLDACSINQLGLVAGEPVPVYKSGSDTDIDYYDYTDIKLISCVNFKSRDLSNTENTLKITYKIYCL